MDKGPELYCPEKNFKAQCSPKKANTKPRKFKSQVKAKLCKTLKVTLLNMDPIFKVTDTQQKALSRRVR